MRERTCTASVSDFVEFCKENKIRNSGDWLRFCKRGLKPIEMPAKPERQFKNRGWKGWSALNLNEIVSNRFPIKAASINKTRLILPRNYGKSSSIVKNYRKPHRTALEVLIDQYTNRLKRTTSNTLMEFAKEVEALTFKKIELDLRKQLM